MYESEYGKLARCSRALLPSTRRSRYSLLAGSWDAKTKRIRAPPVVVARAPLVRLWCWCPDPDGTLFTLPCVIVYARNDSHNLAPSIVKCRLVCHRGTATSPAALAAPASPASTKTIFSPLFFSLLLFDFNLHSSRIYPRGIYPRVDAPRSTSIHSRFNTDTCDRPSTRLFNLFKFPQTFPASDVNSCRVNIT